MNRATTVATLGWFGFVSSLVAHWVAARKLAAPVTPGSALVVLGYPSLRSGRPHPIQRWRCALAIRTASKHHPSTVVFSGCGRAGERSEAQVMARLARDLGLQVDEVLEENRAVDTWENVAYSIPLVADANAIILVSDPLHAARARGYWLKQRPQDIDRVFVTDSCSFWDGWWLKAPTALNALKQAAIERLRPHQPDLAQN